MATKTIAWQTGSGNITLTYNGQGDGTISVQSDANIDADGLHPTDRCYREVYAPIVHEAMGVTQHFHEYQKD